MDSSTTCHACIGVQYLPKKGSFAKIIQGLKHVKSDDLEIIFFSELDLHYLISELKQIVNTPGKMQLFDDIR
jgi:hypothetical protein